MQDPIGGSLERNRTKIRRVGRGPLAIMPVDQNGAAGGGGAGIDIAPAIADDKAGREIDPIAGGGFEEQAWFGLAARTIVAIVVPADIEIVNRQPGADFGVERFDH